VLVVGPARCGKTAALAIPAILEWEGPVLALSGTTDILSATEAQRRAVGNVTIFDPTDVTGQPTDGWSPLTTSYRLSDARRVAKSIASSIDWNAGAGNQAPWVAAAEDLVGSLFWLAAHAIRDMESVESWVTSQDMEGILTLARGLTVDPDPETAAAGKQVTKRLHWIRYGAGPQRSSIYSVAQQIIAQWRDPEIARASEPALGTPIDLDWLLASTPTAASLAKYHVDDETATRGSAHARPRGRRPANTLYLYTDPNDAEPLLPVVGGLVDRLLRDIYARVSRKGQPLNPPLLVVIDDAGNWPIRSLPARTSTCPGMGVQVMLLYRSKAQIDAAYGPEADLLTANSTTNIFFSGLSDRPSLDYVESLIGLEHLTARRERAEAPTQVVTRPAPTLRQLPPGKALLIHRGLPPARLRGRYWFRDRHLRRLQATTGVRSLALPDDAGGFCGVSPQAPDASCPPERLEGHENGPAQDWQSTLPPTDTTC
jgi:type IV secretion system protein VirD4